MTEKRIFIVACFLAAFGTCGSLDRSGRVSASDVIVVCPDQFRDALDRWIAYRRDDHLEVIVIPSQRDAASLQRTIIAAADEQTKYVMLVGDSPVIGAPCNVLRQVPIHYAPAKLTVAWGSPPTLATDMPFGDFDHDGVPDAAVGRLPVDDPGQLRKLVGRIIDHEQSDDFGAWRGQVQLTGGVGGFGFLADAAIESVTRTVVTSILPVETRTSVAYASPGHLFCPKNPSFTDAVLDRYQEGARFWVYAGHGRVTALDRVPQTAAGVPVLDQRSVRRLSRPAGGCPIAVVLACYTGASDAPEDSLAEEMLRCDGGPIAVFAGSRITMPYGNAIAAVGLINSVFEQRPPRIGDAWLSTLQGMNAKSSSDGSGSRLVIDALASVISPAGTNLQDERREHMRLYNLFGDPTLKLHHPHRMSLQVAAGHDLGEPIAVELVSPIDGLMTLSFDRPLGAVTEGDPNQLTVAAMTVPVLADRPSSPQVLLPEGVTGPIVVRAIVSGKKSWATAAARTMVRQLQRK